MVATATEACEAKGAAWLFKTVCMLIVPYVVWASSFVRCMHPGGD